MAREARGGTPRSAFVEGGALLVLALWVLWDARSYPAALVEGVPGPAFFPRLLAILLAAASAVLVLRSVRGAAPVSGRVEGSESGRPANPAPVLLGTAAVSGCLLVIPWLGTILALVPLVAALMWLTGERSARLLATIPVGFAAFVYLVFTLLLRVPLPSGLL